MVLTSPFISLIVACYFFMNKQKEKERVANGKPAKLTDRSMDRTYAAGDATDVLGQNAFLDLTDKENDEVRRFYFDTSIK
jgi:hypothetical protein